MPDLPPMPPFDLDELIDAFLTLMRIQKALQPGSEERNHIVEARTVLLAVALDQHGAAAWARDWERRVLGEGAEAR